MPPKRVLLDHNVPRQLALRLTDFEVRTAYRMGWSRLVNGELIAKAEADGFDVLITADQNLRYQLNLVGRRLALVVLSTNRRRSIEAAISEIAQAARASLVGSFIEVEIMAGPR